MTIKPLALIVLMNLFESFAPKDINYVGPSLDGAATISIMTLRKITLSMRVSKMTSSILHLTQHNDTQYNDTQRNDTPHKYTQHNDTQHNKT
jgi:hypothetical protein